MKMRGKRTFSIPFARFLAFFAILALLCCLFSACSGRGESEPYAGEHTHVYGHWQDAAPTSGDEVTHEVRYCKICHHEEIRDKQ